MAIQVINIGTSANKGDGDPLRTAFKKINENFAELDVTNSNRDINGSVFADDSTLLVDAVNGTITATVLVGQLPALNGSNLTNLTIPAQTFASLTSKPTTIAGYGITDAVVDFADLGTTPTTLAGYGITDAATSAQGTLAASALQAETITLATLKTEVAASADFADFQTRIAAL